VPALNLQLLSKYTRRDQAQERMIYSGVQWSWIPESWATVTGFPRRQKKIGEWLEVMLNGLSESDAVRSEVTKLFYAQAGFVDRYFYATASGGK
jgi:hypothetical protein